MSVYFWQDFGIWERGDKTNQGITELNASSVGIAKVRVFPWLNAFFWGGSGGGVARLKLLDEVYAESSP